MELPSCLKPCTVWIRELAPPSCCMCRCHASAFQMKHPWPRSESSSKWRLDATTSDGSMPSEVFSGGLGAAVLGLRMGYEPEVGAEEAIHFLLVTPHEVVVHHNREGLLGLHRVPVAVVHATVTSASRGGQMCRLGGRLPRLSPVPQDKTITSSLGQDYPLCPRTRLRAKGLTSVGCGNLGTSNRLWAGALRHTGGSPSNGASELMTRGPQGFL